LTSADTHVVVFFVDFGGLNRKIHSDVDYLKLLEKQFSNEDKRKSL